MLRLKKHLNFKKAEVGDHALCSPHKFVLVIPLVQKYSRNVRKAHPEVLKIMVKVIS